MSPGRAIPRHQIESNWADYAHMLTALMGCGDRATATRRFEEAFADYVGCRHAIAVGSGRLGLHLVLQHLELPAGSEAIIPAFNYFAVVERFRALGLQPVFADVRRADLNLDPERLEECVSPRTRVLLATHMFGEPCRMDELRVFAERHGLIVIEDCAHALGARFQDRQAGTFGRAAVFSLSVLKLITGFGGGVITTDDDDLARAIRADLAARPIRGLWGQGWRRFASGAVLDAGTRTTTFTLASWPGLRLARLLRPDFQQRLMTEVPHQVTGWSPKHALPLHTFQVELARRQLQRIESFITRRRQVRVWLDTYLSQAGPTVQTLSSSPDAQHNGMYYGILAPRAEELSRYLFTRGIDTETAEYRNCADLDIYADCRGACPVAREIERQIVRLPSHPRLTEADVQRIAGAVEAFYARQTSTQAVARDAALQMES